MRFPSLIGFFVWAVGVTAAFAQDEAAAQDDCWNTDKVTCRRYYADADKAKAAITNACAKMSCTPGMTPSPATVTGKVTGFPYTATLRVGNKCAGLNPWSTNACVELFQTHLYPRCKTNETLPDPNNPPVPPNDFPLASKLSACDDSWLSFNFGG